MKEGDKIRVGGKMCEVFAVFNDLGLVMLKDLKVA
jgi:hypothetical protein